jgi:transposase
MNTSLCNCCGRSTTGSTPDSRYCELYQRWRRKQDVVMRQDHRPGREALRRLRRSHDPGQRARTRAKFGRRNLKSGVTRPCPYEPGINIAYEEMARHYGVAVIPARVRKPRDKAKVETGVLIVERWIIAALRKRTFFSLGEVSEAVIGAADSAQREAVPKAGRLLTLCVRSSGQARPKAAPG